MTTATKYKTYPKYKPSGIDWLGDSPEGWEVKRLKYYFDYHDGGVWGNEPNGDENNMICIRVADFDFDHFSINESDLTTRNIPTNQYSRILKKGNLLLEKSGGGEKQLVGRAIKFDSDKRAVCSNFIERLVVHKHYSEDYLAYLMGCLYYGFLNYRSIKQTTGIQNLDIYSYFCECVPFPKLEDQQIIADFLDRETAKIDEVVAKKQKLIELLSEKRQVIISQAVTKGLNPKAKMKNSGISWLGEIPERWEIKRLRFVSNYVKTGSTPDSEKQEYFELGNIPWFTPGDFSEKIDLNDTTRKITPKAIIDGEARLFKKDSILLVGIGATLGKIGFSKTEFSANQQINVIYINNQNVPRFYAYYLMAIAEIVISTSNASTLGILNQEKTKQILCVVPSKQEQIKIVGYIDKQRATFENVMKKVEIQIEKLQEFRQALISNVVTGKVKVN